MMDIVFDINYVVVFLAAVAWFILGSVWFSPALFSKQWQALIGPTTPEAKKRSLSQLMVMSFVLSLVESYILAHFMQVTGAMTFGEGVFIGMWFGLGFIAIPFAIDFLYAGKPWKLYFITAGYQFLGVLLMAGILAQWG